jgi:hypothetical protein
VSPWLTLAVEHGWVGMDMGIGLRQKSWAKGDVFSALGIEIQPLGELGQLSGNTHVWQKRPSSLAFVREWLALSTNPQLVTDVRSLTPNDPTYQDHRHDQSIYSVLAYARNMSLIITDTTWPPDTAPIVACGRWRE